MAELKLQEAQQGMNVIFRTQNESLEMNEEQLRYQNEFIDDFESLKIQDREQISDEDYFRLVAIKNRNLSKLMMGDEKSGDDSPEMSAVKENLSLVEEKLKNQGELNSETIEEIVGCYSAAISSCKYYIETKNPRYEAGKRRKKMVGDTLEYLEKERLQLEEGARLFLENQTSGMTITSAMDLLVLAMIHDSKHSDPIDGIDKSELAGARVLSFEDFASIVANDDTDSSEMIEFKNGALASYKPSDGLFGTLFGESKSSIYNRQMKERLYEIVREKVGENTDETKKFLARFKKKIELTGARTSVGVRKTAIRDGLREAGLLGSSVEKVLAQNERAINEDNSELQASVQDTRLAETVRDIFGQSEMDAQDRKRVAISATKADQKMLAKQIKEIFKKARAAGLDISTPKSSKINELCAGNVTFVQSQIFEAMKKAISCVNNFSGAGDVDYDQVVHSESFVNSISALVITKFVASSQDSRSLWDEELENKIREQAMAIATTTGRLTTRDVMEKVARPTIKTGSEGLDDVIGKHYPNCKAWKKDKESLKKGTALLKKVCDRFKDIQTLTAEGIEHGLTADEKTRLKEAGATLQELMQNEESKRLINFVASEIKNSIYALSFYDVQALLIGGYNFDTSAQAIADCFKDVATHEEKKDTKVDDYDEKLSKFSVASKKVFETIGSRNFSSLIENPSDSVVGQLKTFRDVLKRFSSGRAIIREITVANATFKIAQRPDNTLFFVSDGQAIKLSSTAEQLASFIENDMITHTETYGEDYAKEIFRELDFDRNHQGSYVTSRNVAIKYLAGKLKEKDTFFTNVSTDLLRQWCTQMMDDNLQPETIRENVRVIESTVAINGSETLELLHRYDDTEEARLERARAAEEKAERQREEKVRIVAEATVNIVATPILAGMDAAVKVYNSVSGFAKKKLSAITARFGFGRRTASQEAGEQANTEQTSTTQSTATQDTATQRTNAQTATVQESQSAAVVNAHADRRIRLTKGALMVGAAKQAVGAYWHGKKMAEIEAEAQTKTIELISDMFFTQETWLADETMSVPGKRMQEIIRKNFKTIELLAAAESKVDKAIDDLELDEKIVVDGKRVDKPEIADVKEKIKAMIHSILHMENLKTAVDDDSAEALAKFASLESTTKDAVDSASMMIQNKILAATASMFSSTGTGTRTSSQNIPANESVEAQKHRLKKMIEEAASGGSGQGLFYRTVFENYFKSVSDIDKRAMLASAFRSVAADGAGVDVVMSGYIKGAGPLMQKILQGMPLSGMPEMLRGALADVKSKLAPIPEKVVKAQLDDIKARSKGRITEIAIEKPLGAASVGQAFMCRLKGPEFGQEGKPVVIKVLRPEVRNRMMREKQVLLWCASVADGNTAEFDPNMDYSAMETIGGMQATYQGTLSRIEEELDLSLEAKNAEAGSVYDRGYTTVRSMKVDSVVEATTNTLILEKAEGETVDSYMKASMEQSEALMEKFFEKMPSGVWQKKKAFTADQEELKQQTLEEMKKLAIDMRKKHSYLAQISEQWVIEGIYGSGFYHGDLHAGNIMVSEKGATIIDYGNATILSEEQRNEVVKMVTAASIGSTELFIESFHTLLENTSEEKYESHKAALQEEFEKILKLGDESSAGERIMVCLLKAQEIGIEVPPAIYNFSMSQMRLSNTLDESMSQIKDIESKIAQIESMKAPGETSRGDIIDLVKDKTGKEVEAVWASLKGKSMARIITTDEYIHDLKENSRFDSFESRYTGAYAKISTVTNVLQMLFDTLLDENKPLERKENVIAQIAAPTSSLMIELPNIGSVFANANDYVRFTNLIIGITVENAAETHRQIEEIINRVKETDLYKIHELGMAYTMNRTNLRYTDSRFSDIKQENFLELLTYLKNGPLYKSLIDKLLDQLVSGGREKEEMAALKAQIIERTADKSKEDAYAEFVALVEGVKQETMAGLTQKMVQEEAELRVLLDATTARSKYCTEEFEYLRQNLMDPTQREHLTARIAEISRDRLHLSQQVRDSVRTTYGALIEAISGNAADVEAKMLAFFGAYNEAAITILEAMARQKYMDEAAEKDSTESFVEVMAGIISTNLKSTASMLGTKNIWKYRKELGLSPI